MYREDKQRSGREMRKEAYNNWEHAITGGLQMSSQSVGSQPRDQSGRLMSEGVK